MARLRTGRGGAAWVCVIALAGCGADPVEETRRGGEAPARSGRADPAGPGVRACSLLDIAAARRIIGESTEQPGDPEQSTCIYVNAGVATLTLQLGQADLYDQITILQPHTSAQIGDRARYHVEESGAVAVQFVVGDHSATLTARPIGRSQADYLQPAISVARDVAGRLRSSS